MEDYNKKLIGMINHLVEKKFNDAVNDRTYGNFYIRCNFANGVLVNFNVGTETSKKVDK